jgi:hypothetical protein
MTRKQFYLTPNLDNALKARAAQDNTSEAEIVRAALEQMLLQRPPHQAQGQAAKAAGRIFERARATRQKNNIPSDWVFNRDETHDRHDQINQSLARKRQ